MGKKTATRSQRAPRRTDGLSRELIIQAATDLLDGGGEGALTLRALTVRLRTGYGAIYHHVADKKDVLAAATDDAWLVERAGGSVRVVESSPANFKVTTPHDLEVAEMLLAKRC